MKKLLLILAILNVCVYANAQTELIVNGSFEDDFWPSKQPGTAVYAEQTYAEPLRVVDYFDEKTQGTYPTMGAAPYDTYDTDKGIWFLLNPTGWYYARAYTNATLDTTEGSKCMTIRNVGYGGANDRTDHAYSPFKHTVFQRVSLNNASKYTLTFKYKKSDLLAGPSSSFVENKLSRFVVGIVSSQEVGTREYSYFVDISVPVFGDEAWKDGEVIFDLPNILKDKPNLDFSNSAIFFGIQTEVGPPHATSGFLSLLSAAISFDAVSLKGNEASSVRNYKVVEKISVNDKNLFVKQNVKNLQVFDVTGLQIFNLSNVDAGSQSVFTFSSAGVYIINVDGETGKFLVK
jgi:hypothetical protein